MKRRGMFLLILGSLFWAATPLMAGSSCNSVMAVSNPNCALTAQGVYYGAARPSFVLSGGGSVLNPVPLHSALSFVATINGHNFGMVVATGSNETGARQVEVGPWVGTGRTNGGHGDGIFPTFSKIFFNNGYGQRWGTGWTWDHGFWGSGDPDDNGIGSNNGWHRSDPLAVTPEPFTLLLFGTGLCLMALLMWRRDNSLSHRK